MKFDLKDKKTLLIIGAVLLVLVVLAWLFLGKKSETVDNLTEVASDPVELILGRELLASLEKMKSVKLDTTVLEGEIYKSLKDYTIVIPKQPMGRRDPFSPIGLGR